MAAATSPVTKVFPPQVTEKASATALPPCSDRHERRLRKRGFQRLAGVDEVGRGALFGPVVAAAVILPDSPYRMRALARKGLTDSKQLNAAQRESLDREVRRVALAVSVAEVDAATIDRINIYQASRLAMLLAVQTLPVEPDHLLIDALTLDHPCAQTKLIHGDALSLSIAAASVVAKVYRDRLMCRYHEEYPHYGLGSHKGYGTLQHRTALLQHGICNLHRRSFAPVAAIIKGESPSLQSFFNTIELDSAETEILPLEDLN